MLTSLWLQLPERYIWPSSVWGPTRHTYKHFNEALRFYCFFADFLGIKNVRCFRGNHTEVIVKHTSVVFDTSDCGCVLLSVTSIGKVYKLTHTHTHTHIRVKAPKRGTCLHTYEMGTFSNLAEFIYCFNIILCLHHYQQYRYKNSHYNIIFNGTTFYKRIGELRVHTKWGNMCLPIGVLCADQTGY